MHADTLKEITDSFNLKLLISIIQVSIRYANNPQESNLIIDLMFLHTNAKEFDKHIISPNLCILSNHTSLFVNIIIKVLKIQRLDSVLFFFYFLFLSVYSIFRTRVRE